MTTDTTTTVCPECASAAIHTRSQGMAAAWPAGRGYYCRDCGARFDEPATRERHQRNAEGTPRNGLAAELAAADPEEVRADD